MQSRINKTRPKSFQALDHHGPSLIEKYMEHYKRPKLRDDNNGLEYICYISNHNREHNYLTLFFEDLKFRLTGVKIKLSKRQDCLPNGFILYGHLHHANSENEEWRHIFSSKCEKLMKNFTYYYPIFFIIMDIIHPFY